MIRGITFDKQLMKSKDHAHEVNYYYGGDLGITKGCEVLENVDGNLVVSDGYFIIKGRLIGIEGDEIIEVPSVPSGTLYSTLVFEIDLTKENTISEFNQGVFKILSDASDYPTLIQEDLDNGGEVYQFEFVRFENSVSGIDNMVDTRVVLDLGKYATVEQLNDKASVSTYSATIESTSWTGSSAPFSKAVTVTGILSTDTPILDLVLTGTFATDQTMLENWAKIYRAVTSADTITFYATEVPSANITIQAKVVR
jgi:hypothetical protein